MKPLLLLLAALPAFAQLTPAVPSGPVPAWQKYSVVAIANGVGGCASANLCWSVNGGTPVAKAAALTQSLPILALPANGYVSGVRIKTSTACTGTVTLTGTIGTTGTVGFYLVGLYDLKAAVANANITTALLAATGSDTAAATNVTVGFISTVQTLDAVAAGCAFDVHILWTTLP